MEFDGYLTGKAEKHFYRRSRILGQKIVLWTTVLLGPGVLSYTIRTQNWRIFIAFVAVFMCILLILTIPRSEKSKKQITPKKIIIKDECIICIANKYTETRLTTDVKMVKDFGEYYEICFPFGKISEKYICQKNLLKKGSIQEFETLFSGKIVRQ